jgi:hypothetical protein
LLLISPDLTNKSDNPAKTTGAIKDIDVINKPNLNETTTNSINAAWVSNDIFLAFFYLFTIPVNQ